MTSSLLYPFESSICECGSIKDSSISSYRVININYSSSWLELYISQRYERIDPIVKEHTASFRLKYWADTYRKYPVPKSLSAEPRISYSLGLRNPGKDGGSIFTISGKSVESGSRTVMILDFVVPHFHQVLMRILKPDKELFGAFHSKREKEVLQWLTYGKTSWDISAILKISERTVNYHFGNIMQKLNAVNRAQALAIALDQKLIRLE